MNGPAKRAEQSEHQHDGGSGAGPSRGRRVRLAGRCAGRQVRNQHVEFAVGPGCVESFQSLLKLVRRQPPLGCRVTQPLGNLLPIGV